MSKNRIRLDAWLVKNEIALSDHEAKDLISQGVILVNGSVAMTDNRMIANSDTVLVSRPARFVSRGGEKLESAIQAFNVDLSHKRVLDAGASTGGFTDCVLQHGAREVVALDVGKAQLHDRLVRDPRVKVVDSFNVRQLGQNSFTESAIDIDASQLSDFDTVVADLSFISLRKVASALVSALRPHGNMILLVKPQFEAEKAEVDKGAGVISDPAVHDRTLAQVVEAYEKLGMKVGGSLESPLRGADGNTEFLLYLQKVGQIASHSESPVE
jgi:23S rRNA (cytidine1920-2'-O)/16S rRNA (cytidine1409-2'-O)-methyltransferase